MFSFFWSQELEQYYWPSKLFLDCLNPFSHSLFIGFVILYTLRVRMAIITFSNTHFYKPGGYLLVNSCVFWWHWHGVFSRIGVAILNLKWKTIMKSNSAVSYSCQQQYYIRVVDVWFTWRLYLPQHLRTNFFLGPRWSLPVSFPRYSWGNLCHGTNGWV